MNAFPLRHHLERKRTATSAGMHNEVRLTGVWEKDPEASQPEAYERMLDVMGLTGLQRVTAKLIEGLEIKHDDELFNVSFLTVVPFFKVTEKLKFDTPVQLRRRDLKKGGQTAFARRVDNGVQLSFEWGNPGAGTLVEEYSMSGAAGEIGGQMTVKANLVVDGQKANSVQVYRRTGKNRDELLKNSKARNRSNEA